MKLNLKKKKIKKKTVTKISAVALILIILLANIAILFFVYLATGLFFILLPLFVLLFILF